MRAFHVDVGAAAMDGGPDGLRAVGGRRRQIRADRMRKGDVRDEAAAEKRADAALRAIEKLRKAELSLIMLPAATMLG